MRNWPITGSLQELRNDEIVKMKEEIGEIKSLVLSIKSELTGTDRVHTRTTSQDAKADTSSCETCLIKNRYVRMFDLCQGQ